MAIGRTRWLRELRAAPAPRSVLVCFPPGGGSAGAFRALAQAVEPDVAVYAVQYPGRQDRLGEPSIPDLVELAAAVTADLDACGPLPKLSLFGHSMGATIAFEVARGLELRAARYTTCSSRAASPRGSRIPVRCTRVRMTI